MKIAILYIATGGYVNFFEDFHNSCEKNFLDEYEKSYFVFSDAEKICGIKNVHFVKISHQPWPINTLLRFNYFFKIKNQLKSFDYIFFFNANSLVVNKIDSRILPDKRENYLVGVTHPGYELKSRLLKPFERRINLSCKIGLFKDITYHQGCFNGGRTPEFLELIKACNDATNKDLKNNKIARVHDESYLNWYFSSKPPKTLSKLFAWPEEFGERNGVYIKMRDKNNLPWYKDYK